MKDFKSLFEIFDDRLLLGVSYTLIILRILVKTWDVSLKCHWPAFFDITLVLPLLIVILVNFILFILARYWSRILGIPASFIFLIFPFFFYFLLLVNGLLYRWDDRFVLWASSSIFILGAWFWVRGIKQNMRVLDEQRETWKYVLVGIFVLQGFILFLSQNFRADRVPFADENSFWYVAAKEMLTNGFVHAHQGQYPGGGLHPLGVPFLNAFPGMFFNLVSPRILFFMPVYVFMGLTLVLVETVVNQKKSTWGIIFFLVVWFASLNSTSWPGRLFYSMVYGESISMVLVLSLLSWLASHKERYVCSSHGVAAFLIGLLALTKFPLLLLSVAFFVAFLMQVWDRSYRKIVFMTTLFSLPFFILKVFQMKYGGTMASLGSDGGTIFHRLDSPNMDMLRRVIVNISGGARNLWYYSFVAVFFSLFYLKQWRYSWPLALWALFLFIYYSYIYKYGMIGMGDAASGLRYFLPVAAGAFFLGSYGFASLMDWIDQQPDKWLRFVLHLTCLGVIFYKLF